MFRKVLDKLSEVSRSAIAELPVDPNHLRVSLHRYTSFLLSQLHEHHTIEDRHYFPLLERYDSGISRGFALMEADHVVLDRHIHTLAERTNDALLALTEEGSARAALEALADQHHGFARVLDRHLTDEEELVVPLILEYGDPSA